jgi:FtsP/CotA-like multicopper oxidase with cupredoxin domain
VGGTADAPQINHLPLGMTGATVTLDGQTATSGMVQPGMVMTGRTTAGGMGMGGSGYTMQKVQLMSSFTGWIQSIDPAASRLTVMGQAIQVNALTQLAQENQDGTRTTLTLADFLAGDFVSVYGSFLGDGSYRATRIERRKPGLDTTQSGAMAQVSDLNTTAKTFTLGTWAVSYGSATVIGTLANGVWAQVRGTVSGNQIAAAWVNVMGAMGDPGSGMGLRGLALNLNTTAKTFDLMSLTVDYSAAAVTGSLAEGAMVEVQGALASASTTSLIATRVEVEFPGMGGGMSDQQAKGTVSAFDPVAMTLAVAGHSFWMDGSTLILAQDATLTPAQLKVGDWVAVMADSTRKNAAGYAYATRIAEMTGTNGGMGSGDLMGPVALVNASAQSLVVNGFTVGVTGSTSYESQGVSMTGSSFWGAVQVGSMVEAFGSASGSTFAASRLVLGGMSGMGGGGGMGGGVGLGAGTFTTAMPVPPLLASTASTPGTALFNLKPQAGSTAFLAGKPTVTWGYNGALLGPTLRVHRGDSVTVKIDNQLPEATTIHWHGLVVPSSVDGGPMDSIAPGGSAQPQFVVNQPAATLWYHPHIHGHTGYQVYMGLAGFLLVDDPASDALALPKTYGVNDFPVAVQDRTLDANGNLVYLNTGMGGAGMMGDQILANGAITPYLEVPAGLVRLRLLDGSNARRFAFFWEDNRSFSQIGSDGGLLTAPVPLTKLAMAPAERADILVDFSHDAIGKTLELRSDNMIGMGNLAASGAAFPVLQVRVVKAGSAAAIPAALASITRIPEAQATATRTFTLSDMGTFAINGKTYDPSRIDEHVPLGATEIWEVVGSSPSSMGGGMGGGMGSGMGMAHPFHVHGVQFQVLSRSPGTVPVNEQGWKDTVLVSPAEHVRLILRLTQPGLFPYHCHILEHEDRGMMGLFEVK